MRLKVDRERERAKDRTSGHLKYRGLLERGSEIRDIDKVAFELGKIQVSAILQRVRRDSQECGMVGGSKGC